MNKFVGKTPEHETIYKRVKEMVLFGEVVPGQPITIHGLADGIGAGATPVREAIRRLTAEGALVALENRRVVVPTMTHHWLDQIALVRLTVEPELAALAAAKLNTAAISELEETDALVNQSIEQGDIRGYLEANYRFHFLLYDAADARILQRIAESLWVRIGPSLRVVCGRIGTTSITDQHRAATTAMRDGDVAKVKHAIEEDIRQGIEFVRQSIND